MRPGCNRRAGPARAFSLNTVSQEGFGELPEASQFLHFLALGLLGVLIGFLIVPAMQPSPIEGVRRPAGCKHAAGAKRGTQNQVIGRSSPSRSLKPPLDTHIYKERHVVECCINKPAISARGDPL
jgi:hypothetical protein